MTLERPIDPSLAAPPTPSTAASIAARQAGTPDRRSWLARWLKQRDDESKLGAFGRKLGKIAPKTLLARAVIIIMVPVVLLQLITVYMFYEAHWDTVSGRLTRALVGDINLIIAWRADFPGEENFRWMQQRAKETMRLDVSFAPGAVLDQKSQTRSFSILDRMMARALDRYNSRPYFFDAHSEDDVTVKVQLADGVLSVISPLSRLFSPSSYVFVMLMVGTALILFGVALLFMHQQIEPIRRLAAIAENLGKGRDVPDFQPEGSLETRQAATAFLTMRERLRRQIQQRTEMLAGVSHDLRTPITRMKLSLALLEGKEEVAELKDDLSEMEQMIEGYLAFARGEGDEEPAPVDFAALLEEVVSGLRRTGKQVELSVAGELPGMARPLAIKRCITNLAANAARFGSRVEIAAIRRKRAIDIVIDDNGPGIPPEQREDVFRPFVRLEQSRNRSTGGVGLGLTIARDVARAHGGDLTLSNSPMGGLRAKLRLPI
jgi:two-component system osmolarity sensor histidine kinase EnvZ